MKFEKRKFDSIIRRDKFSVQDQYGNTILHEAINSGDLQTVHTILSSEIVNVDAQDDAGNTALHLAAAIGFTEGIEVLLKFNANTNAVNHEGFTPLHSAVIRVQEQSVQALLNDKKLKINIVTFNERTPFELAIERGYVKIAEHLIGTSRIGAEKTGRAGLLHILPTRGTKSIGALKTLNRSDSVIRYNQNLQDVVGNTPLHIAIIEASDEFIEEFIKIFRPDAGIQNNEGNTTLHLAIQKKRSQQTIALIVQRLRGLEKINNYCETVIHLAVERGNRRVLELLLRSNQGLRIKYELPYSIVVRVFRYSTQLLIA